MSLDQKAKVNMTGILPCFFIQLIEFFYKLDELAIMPLWALDASLPENQKFQ